MPRSPFEHFSRDEDRVVPVPVPARVPVVAPAAPAAPPPEEENLPAISQNHLVERVARYKELSEEQRQRLVAYMLRQDLGVLAEAAPMVCQLGCQFRDLCPLTADRLEPIGKPCPVEGAIVDRYRDRLAASLGVDLSSPEIDVVDAKLIDDLATIQMLKRRIVMEMGLDPKTAKEVTHLVVNGAQFKQLAPDPRYRQFAELTKWEVKIQQELLATRRARVQAGAAAEDASTRAANLLTRIRKAARDAGPIVDAEFEVREPPGDGG